MKLQIIKKILNHVLSPIQSLLNGKTRNYFLLYSFIFSILYNLPLYNVYYTDKIPIIFNLVFSWLMLYLLIQFLALYRKTFIFIIPVLCVSSAVASYFVFYYKIYINESVIALMFETTAEESGGLLGWRFYLWIAGNVGLSISLIYLKNKVYEYPSRIIKRDIIVIYLLLLPLIFVAKSFAPYLYPLQIGNYLKYRVMLNDSITKKTNVSLDSFHYEGKPVTIVLVIGESARWDHFHINGYERQTTPEMEKIGMHTFGMIIAAGGDTRTSIPRMITAAGTNKDRDPFSQPSIINILRKNGFYTAWISNQGYLGRFESPVTALAKEAEYIFFNNKTGNYSGSGKYAILDEDLLPQLNKALNEKRKNRFIVIHTIGSHWKYDKHYPDSFRKYTPVCDADVPNLCERNELVNTYDNSILYADYFVSKVVESVKARGESSVVLYTSDHGEGLGEKGLFGHVQNEELTGRLTVPWIVWVSDEFKSENEKKYKNLLLSKKADYDKITHNWLFTSILDGSGIESPQLDLKMSIFSEPKKK
jgi:glucan phosphoethanolaminetransferase (alkaline phosphatase superfamily)